MTFTVLLDNLASVAGLLLAFAGILASQLSGNPVWDGIASVSIGILLCATSVFLVKECMHLLLGESVDTDMRESVLKFSAKDQDVETVVDLLTMYFAPDEILLTMDVNFKNHLTANDIQSAIDRMEQNIQKQFPDIKKIFIKAESKRR